MPEYGAVLAAIDLSDESNCVIQRGLRLVGGNREKLHLIHACEHPITGYGEATGKNHVVTEVQIRQEVYPDLENLARAYEIPQENLHIEFGKAADVIHEMADKLHAELIVIGSHGKKGLELLLGSTANSVIHGATCDVLTVRIR